jgi:hypothetical protein
VRAERGRPATFCLQKGKSAPTTPQAERHQKAVVWNAIEVPNASDYREFAMTALNRRIPPALLLIAALLEGVFFLWTCSFKSDAFEKLFCFSDTGTYVRFAKDILTTHTLGFDETRTLGYPLFLCPCLQLGGDLYGYKTVIGVQLMMNLVFVGVFWRMLRRIAPDVRPAIQIGMSAIFFLAGFGMAIRVLTDFQAAFFFTLFLYGLFFGRSWPWMILASASLIVAILTRPTFSLVVVLLLVLPFAVRRFSTAVPWSHLVAYALCGTLAAMTNLWQEKRSENLVNARMSLPTFEVQCWFDEIHYDHLATSAAEDRQRSEVFTRHLAASAGKPMSELTRKQVDQVSFRILKELTAEHPAKMTRIFVTHFVKSLLAPIEHSVCFWFLFAEKEEEYCRVVRYALGALCLPLWLLCWVPPWGSRKRWAAFYWVLLCTTFYVLAISALAGPGAGERFRFAVLPLMFVWASINFEAIVAWIERSRERRASEPSCV